MDKHNFATRHLLARSLLSYLLYPASLIYAGYMLFRRKFLFPKPFRAPFKVISIGNIVSGGSGKTPITIALAKALQNHGLKVAVASRAYKAGWENSAAMISDGKRLLTTVANAGDEALMVASALPGIPVYVGRKRKDVLRLIAPSQPDVVILDDAMQHLRVARDLDIVIFDGKIGLGNGFVIPAGYLREPLSAIPKQAIILLHSKDVTPVNDILQKALCPLRQPIFSARSHASKILNGDNELDPNSLKGQSISLVSAIAHPESFESSVRALGLSFCTHHRFPDHFAFTDVSAMRDLLQDTSHYLLCTTKDYQKLLTIPTLKDRLLCLSLTTILDEAFVRQVLKGLR